MRYAFPMETLIPAFLRRQRNQRRLTLENLSAKVDMPPQHLSEIESGKRDPRLSSIERMADATQHRFDIDVQHLARTPGRAQLLQRCQHRLRLKNSLPGVQLFGVQAVLAAVFRALGLVHGGRLNDGGQLGFGIPVIWA